MTRERHERVSEVFLEACGMDPSQRAAYLDAACAGDDALRAEIDSLLANDGDFLTRPALDSAWARSAVQQAVGAAPSPLAATSIGRYRILEVIGEGGMGVVYKARQDHPERIVALKVIRHSAVSPRLLRRFEHEAQMLARLQHPGIAQIFDAGTADTGRGAQPFIAMEFIDGEPLGVYADRHGLDTRRRLELMAQVCEAVHHAHMRGVIHRDLKPGNILVDDTGRPKILDFGIARASDADVRITTIGSDIGQLIGTLPYMSPEQVGGDGDAVDSRSDVYALGVLCYELLAGRLPLDVRQSSIADAARRIRDEDPTPLSSVQRVFRGDIETMVLKAMEKDPARRYGSAAEFAADIRRHLGDQPIVARPAGTWYQFGKFARRNRALVGAMAALFVVLAAGVIATGVATIRARDAEQRARRELASKSAIMQYFLSTVTSGGGPAAPDMTMRQMLNRAEQQLPAAMARLASNPEDEAYFHDLLGMGLGGIGEYERAEPHLAESIRIREEWYGPDDPRTLLARIRMASSHVDQGRFSEAEAALDALRPPVRRQMRGDSPESNMAAMELYHALSQLYIRTKRPEQTTAALEEFRDLAARRLGPSHPAAIDARKLVAEDSAINGRPDEAREIWRGVRADLAARPAPDDNVVLIASMRLFQLSEQLRDDAEAERWLEDINRLEQRIHEPGHRGRIHHALRLAEYRQAGRRFDEARRLAGDALDELRDRAPEDHYDVLRARGIMAGAAAGQGDDEASAEQFELLLRALNANLQRGETIVARWVDPVAQWLDAQGRAADADALYGRALDAARMIDRPLQQHGVDDVLVIAESMARRGRTETADAFLADLLHGPAAAGRARQRVLIRQGRLLTEQQRFEEAETALDEAARLIDVDPQPHAPIRAELDAARRHLDEATRATASSAGAMGRPAALSGAARGDGH